MTAEDVHDLMHDHEVDVFTGEGLVSGQDDPLAAILARVTAEFRQAIRSCERNRVSPEETLLPEAVIGRAAIIARHRLLTRFDDFEIGESRLKEYERAERFLEGLARCQPTVESPDGADATEQARPGVQVVTGQHRGREFTRDSLRGL